jgi:flavin-dependent dehydrogenase
MSRLPDGFVVMGDALCTFNPIYGQGMSVAALEAKMLDSYLREQLGQGTASGMTDWTQHFQKALVNVVKDPWKLTISEDFRFSETKGKRPFGTRLFNWYMRRIHELMASNPLVTLRGYEVLGMVKPLTALFHPRIVWAVLIKELASPRQKPVASLLADEASSPAPTRTMDVVAR